MQIIILVHAQKKRRRKTEKLDNNKAMVIKQNGLILHKPLMLTSSRMFTTEHKSKTTITAVTLSKKKTHKKTHTHKKNTHIILKICFILNDSADSIFFLLSVFHYSELILLVLVRTKKAGVTVSGKHL